VHKVVWFNAFHWQPVRSTKKMASIAARSGTRGLWQPSGCFGRGGSNGSISAHNASGSRQPSSRTGFRGCFPFICFMPYRWGSNVSFPSEIGS
jgi:hypothetical protein